VLSNLLVFLLGFVAALVVIAAIPWGKRLLAPPVYHFIETRTPVPRTAATPAISKEDAAEITKFVESIDAAHLPEVKRTASSGDSSADATLTGRYQGDRLVEIQRTRSTPTGIRSLTIYYRNGAIVYVVVGERWEPQSSAPSHSYDQGTRISFTNYYVADGRIVTYWVVPGGVVPIYGYTDSEEIAKEVEQQMLADDAVARKLFAHGWSK
jgi:hypothetical protein